MATKKTEATKAAPAAKKAAPKSAAAKEAPAKKTAAKKPAAEKAVKVKKDTSGRSDGIHAPVKPSEQLAAIVGDAPLARGEIVSRMWDYIKKHKLQNPDDGREILADPTLEAVFGKKKVTMFEMNKIISAHVS